MIREKIYTIWGLESFTVQTYFLNGKKESNKWVPPPQTKELQGKCGNGLMREKMRDDASVVLVFIVAIVVIVVIIVFVLLIVCVLKP